MSPALLLVLACARAPDGSASLAAPTLTARAVASHVDAKEPVEIELKASAAEGWTVTPGAIDAPGLSLTPAGQDGPVRVGDSQVSTWRYELRGDPGSYVITPSPGSATGPDGTTQSIELPKIFVDIGVDGPTGGPMADLLAPPPPEPFPWVAAGAATLAMAGTLAALAWWRRRARRPAPPPPPPPPPDVLAIRAWEAARLAGLDDHALALELSRILRVYLEAVTGLPATAGTTREILADLEQDGRMSAALIVRSARVLDATDRLKFAREGGGQTFFDALEEDFRAVVEALRPRVLPPEERPHV